MADAVKTAKGNLRCRVITPRRQVFDEMVQSVELDTAAGAIEVFARYEPTIAPLNVGVMKARGDDGGETELAIHGGYMDMNGSVLVILADSAEVGSEIDPERAKQALERARAKLAELTSDNADDVNVDTDRARLALLRALTRLRVAGEDVPPDGNT
ncbi:MAG: ATP synthase F1 subunit epsilon [Planctomycetota bacterium]|jgi:F-type H+-transporting ATPase subunit epsilon|nr:ATP synthase F1 subunit epsilon [Planctomycetota bacterium]